MKTNWSTKKLGEVCDIQSGFGFSKIHQGRLDEKFPFLKVSDMNLPGNDVHILSWNNSVSAEDLKEYGFKTAPPGTIIFPKVGGAISTNKKRILSCDSVYDNNVMGLIPTKEILSEYLYYWVLGFNLSNWASGSTLPAINQSRVAKTEIPLPSLPEQKKIVVKLEKLLAKVNEAKKLRAEAQEATSQLLPAELHKIFEEGKKKGWEEMKMGEILKLQGGFAFKSSEYSSQGIPLVRIQNLKNGHVDLSKAVHLPNYEEEKYKSYLLNDNDILIAMSGATTGKMAIVTEKSLPAYLNQRVGRFLIDTLKKVDKRFLWFFLKTLQAKFLSNAYGGAQPNISPSKIESMKIPLPPLPEQKKIVARLNSISEKAKQLQEYQKTTHDDLRALEQSILSKAFSGNFV